MTRQPLVARRAEELLGSAVVATAHVAGGDPRGERRGLHLLDVQRGERRGAEGDDEHRGDGAQHGDPQRPGGKAAGSAGCGRGGG